MSKIPEWLKSDGLSNKEIEKVCCKNGSFTCGLRQALGLDGRCNLCKKVYKMTLSDYVDSTRKLCDSIRADKVKEAIKEFIDIVVSRKIESSEIIREQAKEIFGERLI